MGNRAVITQLDLKYALYLHWNGGRSSVEQFLEVYRRLGNPPFEHGRLDTMPRLAQVCRNFFGPDGLSVGIGLALHQGIGPTMPPKNLGYSFIDNGYYFIDGYDIVCRSLPYEGYIDDEEPVSHEALSYVLHRQARGTGRNVGGENTLVTAEDSDVCLLIPNKDIALASCELCKALGFRPANSDEYGWACLAQVACNFSCEGVLFGTREDLEPARHAYEVDATNWNMRERPTSEALLLVNEAQPVHMRIVDAHAFATRLS